jgi:SAM-dependent methyltransferase
MNDFGEVSKSAQTHPPCIICGNTQYAPGYGGRVGRNGSGPTCTKCGSAERHRVVRSMYAALSPLTRRYRALQFAPDNTLLPDFFLQLDYSVYGGENSIDMMDTKLTSGSYDLVASNHVLEHVRDHFAAVSELLRVVGPNGIVHVNVPSPTFLAETRDWGYPDPARTYHYRVYGADAGYLLAAAHANVHVICAVGLDVVTATFDIVYWLSLDPQVLLEFTRLLLRAHIPVVKIK